jgi:hypothetical protein
MNKHTIQLTTAIIQEQNATLHYIATN